MILHTTEPRPEQLLELLPASDWEVIYHPKTLAKGKRLSEQYRVLNVVAEEAEMGRVQIGAQVIGTRVYRVEINLGWDEYDGQVVVSGECTCPAAVYCKHEVAVLTALNAPATRCTLKRECTRLLQDGDGADLALFEPTAPESSPGSPNLSPRLQEWLDRVRGGFTETAAGGDKADPFAVVSPNRRLVYIVTDGPNAACRLGLELKVATTKKHGFSETNISSPNTDQWKWSPPAYLSEGDRKLVHRGRLLCDNYASNEFAVKGEGTADWLREIIATGRCFWKTPDSTPLKWGGSRPGTLGWKLNDYGVLKATIATEPPCREIALTQPPVYLDAESGEVGEVELNVPNEVSQAWLEAPPISARDAESLEGTMEQLPEAQEAKLPIPKLKMRVLRSTPKFVARFVRQDVSNAAHHWYRQYLQNFRAVEILAEYEGHRFPCSNTITTVERVKDGEGVLTIYRDISAETAAWQKFVGAGFVRLGTTIAEYTLNPEFVHFYAPKLNLYGYDEDSAYEEWVGFFAAHLPELEKAGWTLEIADNFGVDLLCPDDDDWFTDLAEESTGMDWFNLRFGVTVDDEEIDLLPVLHTLLENGFDPQVLDQDPERRFILEMPDGRHLDVPAAKLKLPFTFLHELFGDIIGEDGSLRIHKLRAAQISALDPNETALRSTSKALRDLGANLANFAGLNRLKTPRGVKAEMRPYQRDGLAWLQFLRKAGLGGILADDMGLGKTLQTLAHLQTEKLQGRADLPSLVVAPTSVVHNWEAEARKFVPNMSVLVLHGPERKERFAEIPQHNLVVTTYALVHRDRDQLSEFDFHYIVLDEAQHIKNPKAKAGEAVRGFNARQRLCLTGTPMENHLGELWSLFHFLTPGFLGSWETFRKVFRNPIEKHGDHSRQKALAGRVAPLMLRRTKEAVASDLPPKTEIPQIITLYDGQKQLYETVRAAMDKKVRDAISKKGLARSSIIVLDALLKLRQICCHPALLKQASAKQAKLKSAKLDRLVELIPELTGEGRRILLFSQFTSMLSLIEDELAKLKLGYLKLTGSTKNRQQLVEEFQTGDVPVFLISLKAGGTGLNLTAADTVIHYDPWWNPAVENQATDRAHRIGQDKAVFVHKLICAGSIEERIQELQAKKASLAEGILTGKAEKLKLTEADLNHLLAPLPE